MINKDLIKMKKLELLQSTTIEVSGEYYGQKIQMKVIKVPGGYILKEELRPEQSGVFIPDFQYDVTEQIEYLNDEMREPRRVTRKNGEIVKNEPYRHQDGSYSTCCINSGYCRCSE